MQSELDELRAAVLAGDLPRTRELLRTKPARYHVNCMDTEGHTPLYLACSEGHLEIVRVLVSEFQADVAIEDEEGKTAVMVAALGGYSEVVEALVTQDPSILEALDKNGQAVFHYACAGGNTSLVGTLACEYNQNVDDEDDEGNTPLHVAALYGKDDVVFQLIDKFNADKDALGHLGRTLLHSACSGGNVNLVQSLILNYMADIDVVDEQNDTPLHVAAACGREEVVFTLIKRFKCDLDMKGHLGRTLLHSACSGGNISLVRTLIFEYKADVTSQDKQNYTPLQVAILYNKLNVVSELTGDMSILHTACSVGNCNVVHALLMEDKASINDRNDQNNTPLHVAASWGQRQVVLMLIKKFKCNLKVRGHLGRSLLHCACMGGNINLVETLINEYRAELNVTDDHGYTPLQVAVLHDRGHLAEVLLDKYIKSTSLLHVACSMGNIFMVRALLFEHRAGIYLRDEQNNAPIHVAALRGQEKVTSILIDDFKCDPNMTGHLGRTVLHAACIGGHVNLVKKLIIEHKANIHLLDDENTTPLKVAVQYGKRDIALALVEGFGLNLSSLQTACIIGDVNFLFRSKKEKIDINERNEHNDTALHTAAVWGREEIISILITKFNCDPNVKGHLGRTALHHACSEGHLSLVKMLIHKHTADINALDDRNYTPLQVAVLHGRWSVAESLLKEFVKGTSLLHTVSSVGNDAMIRTLLFEHRADIYLRDKQNNAPIHVAAFWGEKEVIFTLIHDFLCDPNVRGYLDRTVLHSACSGGHVGLVRTLILELKADINALDSDTNTPLQVAALYGKSNVIEMLVKEFGCDLSSRNGLGRTLLHIACSGDNFELVKILILKHKADINARDYQNHTPLQVAVLCDQQSIARRIITEFDINTSLLHIACSLGHIIMVQNLLVTDGKAALFIPDHDDNTPLHLAASYGHEEVLLLLINAYKYTISFRGYLSRSLLHSACSSNNTSLVKTLINEHNADVNARDNKGNTPLHVAAFHGKVDVVGTLINDFHCDHNASGYLGRSVLHSACSNGSINVVEALAEHNPDMNAKDDQNNTPLHVAALYGEKDMVLALISSKFQCDPAIRGYLDRSLLHSACVGGNADLVGYICSKGIVSPMVVDANGDTPLHIASVLGHCKCIEVLLSYGAPILVRNNSGKTPQNEATGQASILLLDYMEKNRSRIYKDYDVIQKSAKKKYSGDEPITRIFVIGNPGAGKSSLIETLRREKPVDYFRTVTESSVPRHTAGIIPTIYTSKHYRRVIFYDFAGNPEYYSSHAAILESIAMSKKGNNIFIIVVDLRDESTGITRVINYWSSFIRNQRFLEENSFFIVAGSHADTFSWIKRKEKRREFRVICDAVNIASNFILNCCRPQSSPVVNIQRHLVSLTKSSPRHKLSFQASILLGLLEKDFSHVISCSIKTLLSHIEDTGIDLPCKASLLHSVLCELQDIGLLLVVANNVVNETQVVLNITVLTNEVHKILFSDEVSNSSSTSSSSDEEKCFNVGIIPLDHLFSEDSQPARRWRLPEYITKECLLQLQYCQEISHSDIDVFLPPPFNCVNQTFLFFPALCTAKKKEISLWNNPSEVKFNQGWLAQCTDQSGDYFPPRFLHVLLLRLVFKFTISASTLKNPPLSFDYHNIFQRRCCRMWSTGVFWSMRQGVKCIVELIKDSKAVVVLIKSNNDSPRNFAKYFKEVIACVKSTKSEYCHHIQPSYFLLDSINETDFFNPDHMYRMSDVEQILANPDEMEVIPNVSEEGEMKISRLHLLFDQESSLENSATSEQCTQNQLMNQISQESQQSVADTQIEDKEEQQVHEELALSQSMQSSSTVSTVNDFTSYVSSLPPAVRPHLECKLDKDSKVDTDLREIAHHMLDWDLKLATYLQLTEVDISDIKEEFTKPELRRRAALKRWKNQLKHCATYGNLLQVFVDAGHGKCAKVLCEVLRKKYASEATSFGRTSTVPCKPKTTKGCTPIMPSSADNAPVLPSQQNHSKIQPDLSSLDAPLSPPSPNPDSLT